MKILLLGANGQLGRLLQASLGALGDVLSATRDGRAAPDGIALDLLRGGALEHALARLRPDLVVNAAAYTAVDRAEQEPELAMAMNAGVPARLGSWARDAGARVLHYSTDYVFDGQTTRPYREDDAVAPRSVYGTTKAAGELALRESGARHLVLRTAWVYSGHSHNFLRTVLRLARERDELRIVSDQHGTPTPAAVIADATARLLALPDDAASGTLHLTCKGRTSWHGFAQAIVARACRRGLIPRAPEVLPIATHEWPTLAERPHWSVLDVSRAEALLGAPLPQWEDALERVFDTEVDGAT